MKKIEFVVAICIPLFFMTSCSKKTPEKAETQVSSEDVKRETGEPLKRKTSGTAKREYRRTESTLSASMKEIPRPGTRDN